MWPLRLNHKKDIASIWLSLVHCGGSQLSCHELTESVFRKVHTQRNWNCSPTVGINLPVTRVSYLASKLVHLTQSSLQMIAPSWETLSRYCLSKVFPDSSLIKWWEVNNIYSCCELLGFGEMCYATTDNKYSVLPPPNMRMFIERHI